MRLRIEPFDHATAKAREADFDGDFELGQNLNGRVCRVAHHQGIRRIMDGCNVGVRVRTMGNIYTLLAK